jgi:8-oxo-dGTP pyrophosphatase MutT (NUDIX family)
VETTRHFTATLYVVADGATALHDHERLGRLVPPGGHVDRDELPHETALREAREETGLAPSLLRTAGHDPVSGPSGHELPLPRRQMLYDVDVHDGRVAHQHVDHVYFATAERRPFDPGPDEAPADAWAWYDADALRGETVDPDVRRLGLAALDAAG